MSVYSALVLEIPVNPSMKTKICVIFRSRDAVDQVLLKNSSWSSMLWTLRGLAGGSRFQTLRHRRSSPVQRRVCGEFSHICDRNCCWERSFSVYESPKAVTSSFADSFTSTSLGSITKPLRHNTGDPRKHETESYIVVHYSNLRQFWFVAWETKCEVVESIVQSRSKAGAFD